MYIAQFFKVIKFIIDDMLQVKIPLEVFLLFLLRNAFLK